MPWVSSVDEWDWDDDGEEIVINNYSATAATTIRTHYRPTSDGWYTLGEPTRMQFIADEDQDGCMYSWNPGYRPTSAATYTRITVTPEQDRIWNGWNTVMNSMTQASIRAERNMSAIVEHTPEERERMETRVREREERRQEEIRRHRELVRERAEREERAERAAKRLLPSILTTEEIDEYTAFNAVTFIGSDNNVYRVLCQGSAEGNVKQLNSEGETVISICCHPRLYEGEYRLPLADAWAGQILALKSDAEEFLHIGNYGGRRLHRQTEPPAFVPQIVHRQRPAPRSRINDLAMTAA